MNNMDNNNSLPENALPVSEVLSKEAKDAITMYRAMGVDDTEMAIMRDFPGGPEEVIMNRSGYIKATSAAKDDGYEVVKALNEGGLNLSLDEELAITDQNGISEQLARVVADVDDVAGDDFFKQVEGLSSQMTFGMLEEAWNVYMKTGHTSGTLPGTRKYRTYIYDQLRRLAVRYGENALLKEAARNKDAHAVAVVLNTLGQGEPDRESVEVMEKAVTKHMATL